jgi:hypothetical protein
MGETPFLWSKMAADAPDRLGDFFRPLDQYERKSLLSLPRRQAARLKISPVFLAPEAEPASIKTSHPSPILIITTTHSVTSTKYPIQN